MTFPLPPWSSRIFFILGVLAALWAVLAYRSQRRYLLTAQRASGIVQGVKAERMKQSTVYFPVIQFTTATGVAVIATSKSGKSRAYPIGEPISVLYDPDHPDNLEIDAFWSRWLVVISAAFVALVCFGIGATVLLNRPG